MQKQVSKKLDFTPLEREIYEQYLIRKSGGVELLQNVRIGTNGRGSIKVIPYGK